VADAITTLLTDTELAHRFGQAAARRARSFSWPLVAGRVQALLLEQLTAHRVAEPTGIATGGEA
jgi:glycosyltransferase involved in cell wall biosynthesis